LLTFFISCSLTLATEPVPYLSDYLFLFHTNFKRALELENQIDGLTDEARALIGDREQNYSIPFKGKSKLIDDPKLLNAVITERKRLEKLAPLIDEITRSAFLRKQLQKKIAADFLALEINNIVLIYTEYLNDYLSGRRKGAADFDLDTLKILAATLTGLHFSKEKKQKMAFFNPEVLKYTQKNSQSVLEIVYEGIGTKDEDFIISIPEGSKKSLITKLEQERLQKTQKLLNSIEKLSQIILISNKSLWDEYQYRVMKAAKKPQ